MKRTVIIGALLSASISGARAQSVPVPVVVSQPVPYSACLRTIGNSGPCQFAPATAPGVTVDHGAVIGASIAAGVAAGVVWFEWHRHRQHEVQEVFGNPKTAGRERFEIPKPHAVRALGIAGLISVLPSTVSDF